MGQFEHLGYKIAFNDFVNMVLGNTIAECLSSADLVFGTPKESHRMTKTPSSFQHLKKISITALLSVHAAQLPKYFLFESKQDNLCSLLVDSHPLNLTQPLPLTPKESSIFTSIST